MKKVEVNKSLNDIREEVMGVLSKHMADNNAVEILAVMSCVVGQLVAMQDQRKYSSDQIMEIVAANTEEGNRQIIDRLAGTEGTMQ